MYEVLHQNYHLQGFTASSTHLYWSFTDTLVKTTPQNTVGCQIQITGGHLGDIDYRSGCIYGTVLGNSLAGDPWGVWSSFHVYVFDADTLALKHTIRLDPLYRMFRESENFGGFFGVDGIAVLPDNTMWLAGGLRDDPRYTRQQLLHFDMSGRLLEIRYFSTGNTIFGIQNLDWEPDTDRFWFSTYTPEKPYHARETLYCVDKDNVLGKWQYCTPYGFHCLGDGRYLCSVQSGVNGNRQGYAYEITRDMLACGPVTEADTQNQIPCQ